jgi:hypothetical protein
MQITKEEAKFREENSSLYVRDKRKPGPKPGTKHVPETLRIIAGAAGHFSGIVKVQDNLAISDSDAWNNKKHPKVEKIVDQAQVKAAERLLEALGLITPEKMENAKLRDLSAVAADMARILEKTSDKAAPNIQQTQILIYAPRTKDEDEYKIIQA